MSVEVASGSYLIGVNPVQKLESRPNFRYGFLHDLESIWWIAMWFLFTFQPEGTTAAQEGVNAARRLFSHDLNFQLRLAILTSDASWSYDTQHLPSAFTSASVSLYTLSKELVTAYTTAFRALTLDAAAAQNVDGLAGLYKAFKVNLTTIIDEIHALPGSSLRIHLRTPPARNHQAPSFYDEGAGAVGVDVFGEVVKVKTNSTPVVDTGTTGSSSSVPAHPVLRRSTRKRKADTAIVDHERLASRPCQPRHSRG
jgi:hypothetical protein